MAEEAAAPATALGGGEIAFLIGPDPRQTIGVAALATGRVQRRISLRKGKIVSFAAAPDGNTIYGAAGGMVWAIPSVGGDPRAIRAGEAVAMEPAGHALTILTNERSRVRQRYLEWWAKSRRKSALRQIERGRDLPGQAAKVSDGGTQPGER